MYAVVVVNKQHKKVVAVATVRENSSNFSLTDDGRKESRNIYLSYGEYIMS